MVTDNVNRIKRKNYQVEGEGEEIFQQRDPSKFFEKEPADAVVSLQIQMVALQFLVANEPALGPEFIDKDVLERLIRKSCRRVSLQSPP